MRTTYVLCLVGVLGIGAGCGGNTVRNAGDAATSEDGATADHVVSDAESCNKGAGNLCTTAKSCTTIANGTCLVTTVAGAGSAPPFMGGTIADGLYNLTGATTYGPDDGSVGQTARITMTFSGNSFALVQDTDASCTDAPSGSGAFSVSGSTLTLSTTCPTTIPQTMSYTATPNTLSYGETNGPTTDLYTFTRRP